MQDWMRQLIKRMGVRCQFVEGEFKYIDFLSYAATCTYRRPWATFDKGNS